MENPKSRSLLKNINLRELNGYSVRKRSFIPEFEPHFREIGALSVENDDEVAPPLSVSFCKTSRNSHTFAVAGEGGYVTLFDSRREFSSRTSHQENAEKAQISRWLAHQNAIFDVCWIKEDSNVLTASGDQTIKLWDSLEKKCTRVLTGHTGSVKSLCSHPTNSDLLVSGSRDGSFALWDLRCKARSRKGEFCIESTAMVKGAHLSPQEKRIRRSKAPLMSITSVLYLKDEFSIATAGAADSTINIWDGRNLKAPVTSASPHYAQFESSIVKGKRLHGISCLSQDSSGTFLTASCMDSRVYLYSVLQAEKGPLQCFTGSKIESFFVKSAISPDAAYVLSGSSDGNAYIWQVNKPQEDPIILEGHSAEVTSVDWCPSEIGKLTTLADDSTVRIWNLERVRSLTMKCPTPTPSPSPSAIRRRIMATPTRDCVRSLMNEEPMNIIKGSGSSDSSDKVVHQINTSTSLTMPVTSTPKAQRTLIMPVTSTPEAQITLAMPVTSTPEAQRKRLFMGCDLEETSEKTHEAMKSSPSSVLNAPSSVKRRTIRDYFVKAPSMECPSTI